MFAGILQIILFLIFIRIEEGSILNLYRSLHDHIIEDYWTTLKMSLPPILLIISMELLQMAFKFLPQSLECSAFYIMSVAIFSSILLKKKFLLSQILAIILITSGLIHFSTTEVMQPKWIFPLSKLINLPDKLPAFSGYVLVVGAVSCYGLSYVILESCLKSQKVSLWIRGIQLNLFNVPLSIIIIVANHYTTETPRGFFDNFTLIAWFFIIFVVACNMMELFVIKVADSIFRMISLAIATMIIGIMKNPFMLYNDFNSPVLKIGIGFIIAGIVLYCIMDNLNPMKEIENEDESEVRESSYIVPLKLYQSVPTVSYKVKS